MKTQNAGQVIKGSILFTIGSELTKKGIDVFKEKYSKAKAERERKRREQEEEEQKLKDKCDE